MKRGSYMLGLKKLFPDKMDLNKLIFRIGEVSKMLNVSTRQLRYWEKKGYIESIRDEKGSSRVFNMENFTRVSLIKYYLDKGFTLVRANEITQTNMSNMAYLRRFVMYAFQDIEMIENQPAINLGYFDDEKASILYGFIDKNDEVKYRVIKNKEEDR